jgi:dinuclear metal center YbgI/SA1388 family protein
MSNALPSARVADVIRAMEILAPPWLAEDWDPVGLACGQPEMPASRVLVALELEPELISEAARQESMIVTHHPSIFSPLANLREDNPEAELPLAAVRAGLAVYSAHTNLDAAGGGVNDVLAGLLGLENLAPLAPAGMNSLVKVVVFAPPEAVEAVSRAMFQAGAGEIGDYRECSYSLNGQGQFIAPPEGRPYIGQAGQRSVVEELRIETLAPRARLSAVLSAINQAHPYEEPAVDVYPLAQAPAGSGMGRVGDLPAEEDGAAFLQRAAQALQSPAAQWAGALPEKVSRVAVVGGSGADYWPQAARAGAQVLLTGEARHHQAQQARQAGICLAVMGHFSTEVVVVESLAQRLGEALAQDGVDSRVRPWRPSPPPWRPVFN